ncbi:MAG: response regulator [Verrucomicrobiota bacterium]
MSNHVSSLRLPSTIPWGVALITLDKGGILAANEHFENYYFDAVPDGREMAGQFGFAAGRSFQEIARQVRAEGSWTGRAIPHHNRHGITSVELTIRLDPENADQAHVYTLEHPSVDGALRFSSRSEMQLLQVLLDNTLEYVFFRDVEGRFILTNRAFRDAVGSDTGSQVVGRTIESFVAEESARWVRGIDESLRRSGRPSVNQVSHFTFKNGTKHWLQMTTVPVRDSEDMIIGSVSVARDISDLKETESELRDAIKQAEDASRAKGEFLAAMSHEIRTPINGIVGASELCQETRLDVEQRGYIDTVMQCSNTLLALVNDVLDFSKIEAGQLNLEKLSFSPVDLIEAVSEEFAQIAHKKGLELIVSYDDGLPRYLIGDPTRIKQILYNLVSNAIKFTEEGEIVIRAATISKDDTHARMLFAVRDTGIGIAEGRKDAVFLSFTQADMTTTRKYGGTGLGLTICRELALLMDGRIEVDSKLGKGSTFTLEVPLELAVHAGADAVPFNPELADLHVLIVDDNETNRDIYQRICAGWGYRSAIACDGMEALNLMEAAAERGDPFKLVILDQQMPGLTGLDIASLILSRDRIKNAELLLLSSSLNRTEIERADKLGIARALSKPVKRSTLLEVVLETFGVRGDEAVSDEAAGDGRSNRAAATGEASLHILLVEDNPVNQEIASRRLEKMGHRLSVVANGLLAVEAVRERRFDCILMDIQMPEMDGYEATRRIREMEQARSLTPSFIVAMTAHAMKGDAEKCLSSGMDDYLPKPFRVERLKEILDHVQARRQTSEVPGGDPRPPAVEEISFKERFLAMDLEDQEDIIESAGVLSESLSDDIDGMESALRRKDLGQVAFGAHTLKGVAGVFGYTGIVDLATELEGICREGDQDKAAAYAQDMIVKLHLMREEIERVVREFGPELQTS